jgi:hypothetical protein
MNDNLNYTIQQDKIAEFLMYPMNNDLLNVPGIDDDVKMKLKKHDITCIYHLLSLYLSFYPVNDSLLAYNENKSILMLHKADKILKEYEIDLKKIKIISSAIFQKLDCMLPGFFDINIDSFL